MTPTYHLNFDIIIRNGKTRYRLNDEIYYLSPRYKKSATVPIGYISDGASGPAEDIVSQSWWIHDILCSKNKWDDGSPCSNWQASMVLHDILKRENRGFRSRSWAFFTAVFRPVLNFYQF